MPPSEPVESPDSTTIFDYHDLTPPTVDAVFAARHVVRRYLSPSPLVRSEALSSALDATVYLKREDTLPTGAFKVRGGLNLAHDLPADVRDPGLIAASTGNHGQSVAYAGRTFDIPVRIVVPEDANPSKVAAIERYGARVEHHGDDFDEAREHAEAQAVERGFRYVHSANEPRLVAGVATAGLEVLEDLPSVDTVLVPVGGGSGAAGYCLTVGQLAGARVVGVQVRGADAVHRAFHHGGLEPNPTVDTFAEGLATRTPFALTTSMLRTGLSDMVLVSDDDLRDAIVNLIHREGILAEGAAVAGIAAARQLGADLAGEVVVIPITGRNLSVSNLQSVLGEQTG